MTRNRSNWGTSENDFPRPGGSGLAIADVLTLPEPLQQLVTWVMRRDQATFAEVMAYTGEDEATTRKMLNTLIEAGQIQMVEVAGELRYHRTRFSDKRGRRIAEDLWQSLSPGSPLAIIRNPSGEITVVAGEDFQLCVTVSNQGNQSAVIEVSIGEESPAVHSWCLMPRDRLTLGPQQSGEVVFQFAVPPQALPGAYQYALVVDSPQHYPEETPITYNQSVQVLPPVQAAVRINDPTFAIQPATTSDQPVVLQPGQLLEVLVQVHNRSDRVDRFRLTCPDLAPNWYSIRYPEGLDTPGLVVTAAGLDLNPGARGQILLLLKPPIEALAGQYSPTIRLYSANHPDLVLLDLVYLQIQPVYFLSVELRTLVGTVRKAFGQFEVKLTNDGNTERQIRLSVLGVDEEGICEYRLEPGQEWILPPKTSATADLRVQPVKWWRRPILGGARPLNFLIELEDTQQYALPTDRLHGTLLWEARPWWQLWVLVLAGLGTLATIALLVWLFLLKPPAPARVLEFAPEAATYQESDREFIRLRWRVSQPQQIQAIRITGQSPEGTPISKPIVYDFSRGVPQELQSVCQWQPVLTCQGVPTEARKAGTYLFELALIPRQGAKEPTEIKRTGPIAILPQQPRITYFKVDEQDITATAKYLIAINPKQPVRKVLLSWKVEGGKNLNVELLPAPGALPPNPTHTYAVPYLLTQRPTTDTLTLKVTNESGQQITKAITIETFEPPLPKPKPPATVVKPPLSLPKLQLPAPPKLVPLPPPMIPGAVPSPGSQSGQPGAGATSTSPAPANPPSPNPTQPAPSEPGSFSPLESPPRFN